eukprot:6567562-Alexandrium_andersonii.AAC.1
MRPFRCVARVPCACEHTGRRLESLVTERAGGPGICHVRLLASVAPSKSAAAAARACVGTHLVSHGKVYPLGCLLYTSDAADDM